MLFDLCTYICIEEYLDWWLLSPLIKCVSTTRISKCWVGGSWNGLLSLRSIKVSELPYLFLDSLRGLNEEMFFAMAIMAKRTERVRSYHISKWFTFFTLRLSLQDYLCISRIISKTRKGMNKNQKAPDFHKIGMHLKGPLVTLERNFIGKDGKLNVNGLVDCWKTLQNTSSTLHYLHSVQFFDQWCV